MSHTPSSALWASSPAGGGDIEASGRLPSGDILDRFCAIESGDLSPALIVVAHFDDETIGFGSRLPHLKRALLAHITDSAPRSMADAHATGFDTREAYASARSAECGAALAAAGVGPSLRRQLWYADQEASLHLVELIGDVAALIDERRPAFIVTHPYEGGHPDHDAAAFAVHTACRILKGSERPVIVEFTSYHNHAGHIRVGEFLPNGSCPVWTRVLDEPERRMKRRMIDCYRTQHRVLQQFPVGCERYRAAPAYDFTAPPHPGVLFYEQFDWGMTGERWRTLARAAEAALHAGERACP